MDIRQSVEYAQYLKTQGWIVERIDNINYFIRKFPLIGSILKLQRPERLDLNKVRNLSEKYRVFQIIIEPKDKNQESRIRNLGYKLSKNPFLPTKTLQIDLTQSEKQIFDNFKKDAKQIIKKAAFAKSYGEPRGDSGFMTANDNADMSTSANREEVVIKSYSTPNELKIFQEAWKKSVKYNRYVPSLESLINLRKSFPQSNSLFLASHNISGNIIGGVIFTRNLHERSNYITYYWQGFTNKEGRALLSQYSLLYQGILWAKNHKSTIFDFEGIYDERFPNKSWLGFTHFKKSFGGYEVLYPGCYTRFRWP